MNQKIDFNDIPKNYLYCTHNKCPRRNAYAIKRHSVYRKMFLISEQSIPTT